MRFARDLPNDITFDPPPCIWLMLNSQNSRKITNGRTYVSTESQPDPPLPVTSIGTGWVRSWLIRFCSVLSGWAVAYFLLLGVAFGRGVRVIGLSFGLRFR